MAEITEQIYSAIIKIIDPIKRRALMTVGRAVILAVQDDKKMQLVQASLLADETKDDMERFQNYGFTSNPLPGCEGVGVFIGGEREHGIMISVDDRRYRLKSLGAGQVAMYDAFGSKMTFKNDGNIEIECTTKVSIKSSLVDIGAGALEKVLNGETFQNFFNLHVHNSSVPGSPTGPPMTPSTIAELSAAVKAAKVPI